MPRKPSAGHQAKALSLRQASACLGRATQLHEAGSDKDAVAQAELAQRFIAEFLGEAQEG